MVTNADLQRTNLIQALSLTPSQAASLSVADLETLFQNAGGANGSGGREVQDGYAEITGTFLKPTGGAGAEDVTGLVFPNGGCLVGLRPIMLHFWASHVTHDTAGSSVTVLITDNNNNVLGTAGPIKFVNATDSHHLESWIRVTPPQGRYQVKVRLNSVGAGKSGIFASATSRAFLRAIEV